MGEGRCSSALSRAMQKEKKYYRAYYSRRSKIRNYFGVLRCRAVRGYVGGCKSEEGKCLPGKLFFRCFGVGVI